jgi:hypothetical protein
MNTKIIFLTVLMLFCAGISYGARFHYTWKDKEGTLNITDYPPPEGTQIIDISIIPEVKKAPPPARQPATEDQREEERQQLLDQASMLREQGDALLEKASDLNNEALEQRKLTEHHRHQYRYRREASEKENEALNLAGQAADLVRKARELEAQAALLK